MRILLVTHSFNGLCQRLFCELTALGHEVSIEFDIADSVTEEAVRLFQPELITIGCPHCSATELEKVAKLLKGKTVSKELWIFTSRELVKHYPEYIKTIEKSGAKVVCDTCMVVSPATNRYSCVMVNSGKALAYVPGMCGAEAVYGNMEMCIEEAVGGSTAKKEGGSH